MTEGFSQAARHTVKGTLWALFGEGLALPTGFLIVVFLTRQLGPSGYGLYTLAAVLIGCIEASIESLFSRTTIKLIGKAENWKPIGASLARMHFLAGCVLASLLCLLATQISGLMGEPKIAGYLRLFALDIPLHSLVLAHKYILVGIGGYRERALSSAGRFAARLMLIALLVELGLSVPGAILGNLGASLVELSICRYFIRPSLLSRSHFPMRRFIEYSLPLFLYGTSIQIFGKLDLFVLTALGGTAAVAGIYAAAQNLSTVPPGVLAVSFSPLLLSTLNRLLIEGKDRSAKDMGSQAMRAVIALLPFAVMTAGAAQEITVLTYGPAYSSAAPVLAILVFGALAMVFISVCSAILIAGGKPGWAFALVSPLVPLAAIGYLVMIPRLGAIGASLITALCAMLGALASVLAVHRLWGILPPGITLLRSLLISGVTYALTALWPAPGILLLVKLPTIVLIILLFYLLLGETNPSEIGAILGSVLPRTAERQNPENIS